MAQGYIHWLKEWKRLYHKDLRGSHRAYFKSGFTYYCLLGESFVEQLRLSLNLQETPIVMNLSTAFLPNHKS